MTKQQNSEKAEVIQLLAKYLKKSNPGKGDFNEFINNFHKEFSTLKEEALSEAVRSQYGTGDYGGAPCPDCSLPLENKGVKKNEFT